MQIIRAKVAGFCFGVQRAVELAKKARGKSVQTLGELIHNPEVLEELKSRGIRAVSAVSKLRDGTVVIRAHGVSDRVRAELKQKKIKIVDASCPFVQRLHAAVAGFIARGLPVVILGRADHPEMRAVVEDFPVVLVLAKPDLRKLKKLAKQKVGVLAQTTETAANFELLKTKLKQAGARIEPADTICNATSERQTAAIALAKQVDLMLVIGGKKSNNTKQLWLLTKKFCSSRWIETERDLKFSWFKNIQKVGITAGASTPESTIERVIARLKLFV
jgi:4-hydroxy-3-methylbut-2-enyl diphosphate reductase